MDERMKCRHCGGTGYEPNRAADAFPKGSKVIYDAGGYCYGHERFVPATVLKIGGSGKRVRIEFTVLKNCYGATVTGRMWRAYVSPARLRFADSASAEQK